MPVVAARARAIAAATTPRTAAPPARRWASARRWKTARRPSCVARARWPIRARCASRLRATMRRVAILRRARRAMIVVMHRVATTAPLVRIMARRVVITPRVRLVQIIPARQAARRASARSAPARSAPVVAARKADTFHACSKITSSRQRGEVFYGRTLRAINLILMKCR